MKVTLPNGIIDGQDHFNVVVLDELRGKQQNYLANKDLVVGNIGHVEKIVTDMILSLQTNEGLEWKGNKQELAWKFPITDLEVILIKIRENTYGERFYHEIKCENCEHVNKNLRLDLNKLEIKPISVADLLDPAKRTFRLPKSELEVELKPLYLKDMMDILKITKKDTETLVTSLTALSIKRLGDKSPVTSADIENLSAKDINFLNSAMEKINSENEKSVLVLEGSIDTELEYECKNCGHEGKTKLNVFDPNFFSHTKTSLT